ncbi:MAG: DNA repair protein RecO [Candidatus Omnitrophota bacterium]|nr:MAG: DNA repair protein RecO [Candidatus Omnitrophota bacterium]
MAVQKTQGFILKREDVRETSLALTIYTRDFGKLKLISKGVRSPDQRFVSAYELFALDDIVFYERKKKNFFLLSQCELINFFPKVRESLERISCAAYFVELLNSVTQLGDKNFKLYELLLNCLELLSGKASPKRVTRIFEIKLLSLLGFMPGIKSCVNCDRKLEKAKSRFSLSLGGALCETCFARDKNARSILAGTINFMSHIADLPFDRIRHVKVAGRVGKEVERLLKSFIGYHLEIRPKSMAFMEKIGV